jgi:aminocarboxymuconate-semialdehyde decarboxylase
MGVVIDGFSHVLPKSFAEGLMQTYPTDELRKLTQLTYFGDMENRVRVLDKLGFDKQVLTLARPTVWMGLPPDAIQSLMRLANDAVAEAARSFPDRFIPVGTLPVPTEDFLPELDRCIEELGMAGIQIFTNVDGVPLDSPRFRSFFAKVNAGRIPVWIHPQLVEGWSEEYVLDKMFGWIYETTIALSRLVFSGLMDDFPNLTIISHHMGGMVPHFAGRIKHTYELRDIFPGTGLVTLPRDPLEYFRKFYGDTATMLSGAEHALECGRSFFGPEHIILATDYPFGPRQGEDSARDALQAIKAAGLPQAEQDMLLGGNLLRLIGGKR